MIKILYAQNFSQFALSGIQKNYFSPCSCLLHFFLYIFKKITAHTEYDMMTVLLESIDLGIKSMPAHKNICRCRLQLISTLFLGDQDTCIKEKRVANYLHHY